MAREFFCEVMGQTFGPLEPADLRRMAKSSELTPTDKVRQGEDGKWVEAGKVKGLFEQRASVAEPKPAPAPSVPVAAKPASVPVRSPQRPPKPVPITPEVLHANDDAVASWIGPAAPLAAQPSPATDWQPSSGYVGQPGAVAPHFPPQSMPVAPYAPAGMAASAPPVAVDVESDYPCPFCGEPIKRLAKKCKHCGEFLDPTLRAVQAPAQPFVLTQSVSPVTTVNVSNVVQVGAQVKRWNRLVAVILSFLIPGLGQLYKGQAIGGAVWFFAVVIGYFLFILPGAILHWCCIFHAASGDPYR